MSRKKATGCPHPPERLYVGTTYDPGTYSNQIWISCCDCGALLRSAFSNKTVRALAAQGETI